MPTFKYGKSTIEITKSYTYLGILFSKSGKFNEAAMDRVTKANQSIGSTLGKLRKAESRSSLPAIKLFNTVISAALLYTAEFWADSHEKILCTAQSKFFKQLYGWPRSTPHYVVRLESQIPDISMEILKRKLRWLVKLLEMNESRLPRQCYSRLLYIATRNLHPSRPNWVSTLREKLVSLGFGAIFDEQNPITISSHIDLILAKEKNILRESDLALAQTSSYCPLYHHLQQHESNYVHFNLSFGKLALISQAMVASKKGISFYWKSKRIRLNPESSCPVCCWDCPDNLHNPSLPHVQHRTCLGSGSLA